MSTATISGIAAHRKVTGSISVALAMALIGVFLRGGAWREPESNAMAVKADATA